MNLVVLVVVAPEALKAKHRGLAIELIWHYDADRV